MPPLDVDAALARDLAASLRHREAEFGLRPLDHDSRSPSRSPLDERIPALDGIRGVAVLLVVLVHTGLLAWGWIGVDLFFALSGFLITGILLEAKAAGGAGWDDYFKPFYLRRALRILPLAYAAMLIVLPFAPIVGLGTPAPTREVMWFVAYVSNWRIWPRGSASWQLNHFWSLAVEEQFYLLWPLVVSVLDARRLRYVCAIFLIAAPALRCVVAVLGYSTSYGHLFENITPLRMDALAAGSLLAALRYTGDFDLWAKRAPLGLAAGAIGFAAVQRSSAALSYVGRYTALALLFGSVILLARGYPDARIVRLFNAKWLRRLGTVSYCIYVVHLPVANWFRKENVGAMQNFLATISIAVAIASVSWYAFERPLLSLKRYWPLPHRARADY